ncbi:MAG: hypothetical protein HN995_07040 [Candidatus Marinimicrobia bacterium]|nr:hypothetical protein [Candidatus Neomarinimicrobiota bacterium]MBT3680981.1 hypothetical protein [Candidatus Neomarinimicrobiota bacterium]MBT3952114.1 hypothetical protein [Candidatus Neomarinimicrobiota bacterium]MBT4254312.1 hypothetical protein [Candidatus Neomarinimicrobiota bacterium]MBT4479493.1 hypothetical protein [Candidatus Neomarinimicrobiota bacterium]
MSGGIDTNGVRLKTLGALRWVLSIGFFFLAIRKGILINKHGIEPYRIITDGVGLPGFMSYYGVIAVLVELCIAVGLWEKKTFKPVIVLTGLLTVVGIVISFALIIFKINSECGCGLMGDNEYGLLFQKIVILALLIVIYRSKDKLFLIDDT